MRTFVAAAVLAGLAATSLAVAPAAHSAPEANVVKVARRVAFLSPNGDGRHDSAAIRFTMLERARVTVRVGDAGGEVLGPLPLGRLDPGERTWRWDGRDGRGRVVPDGSYTVTITAVRGDVRDVATVTPQVRSHPDAGRLVAGRLTVYPRAHVVHDRIQMVYQPQDYDPDLVYYPHLRLRARFVVRDDAGEVVLSSTSRRYAPAWEWDGRVDGKPVPAGEYQVRVVVTDSVGNVRVARRTVVVSDARLTQQTWSTTVAAGAAETYAPRSAPSSKCDCYAPVASTRFTGGLSFLVPWNYGPYFFDVREYFEADVPVLESPVDQYRVTATGGPTVAGGAGTGWLSAGAEVQAPVGDGATTTPWSTVDLLRHPYLPDGGGPVNWSFRTSGGQAYDVATFTIEYRYYAPVR